MQKENIDPVKQNKQQCKENSELKNRERERKIENAVISPDQRLEDESIRSGVIQMLVDIIHD